MNRRSSSKGNWLRYLDIAELPSEVAVLHSGSPFVILQPENQRADVCPLKSGILISEEIIVECAECGLRPMPHSLIEGVNHVVLESFFVPSRSKHSKLLLFGSLFLDRPDQIHRSSRLRQCVLGMHMLRNARR